MIKYSFFLIPFVFVLASCSTYNRIQAYSKNGLTTMGLFQLPSVGNYPDNGALPGNSSLKLGIDYFYAQRDSSPPMLTVGCIADQSIDVLPDSAFTIVLDGEAIPLSPLEGRFVIAENLWVPIVYAKELYYKLTLNNAQTVIRLNTKEKDRLTEFFKRAIKHRDHKFPAIPPGQKKW